MLRSAGKKCQCASRGVGTLNSERPICQGHAWGGVDHSPAVHNAGRKSSCNGSTCRHGLASNNELLTQPSPASFSCGPTGVAHLYSPSMSAYPPTCILYCVQFCSLASLAIFTIWASGGANGTAVCYQIDTVCSLHMFRVHRSQHPQSRTPTLTNRLVAIHCQEAKRPGLPPRQSHSAQPRHTPSLPRRAPPAARPCCRQGCQTAPCGRGGTARCPSQAAPRQGTVRTCT